MSKQKKQQPASVQPLQEKTRGISSDPRSLFIKLALQLSAVQQRKREKAVQELLAIYWKEEGSVNVSEIERWQERSEPLDNWFFFELIRAAGNEAIKKGYSQHKADIAASKNFKERAWVQEQWGNRSDTAQSKAAFSRECVHLVKNKFGVRVTAETIARDWLPKSPKKTAE